MNQTEKIIKI